MSKERQSPFWYREWAYHCTACRGFSMALDELPCNFPHNDWTAEGEGCSEATVIKLYERRRRAPSPQRSAK